MKDDLTYVVIVLDRSASMSTVASEVIKGFNTFLEEHKKEPGEALLTMVQFNGEYNVVHKGVPLKNVPPLTSATYKPMGWTALLDALGVAIDTTGAELAAMKEEDRPSKVIVLVLTDGEENSSKEYKHTQILEKVKEQQEKYAWEFVFIGAGIDAFAGAKSVGINADLALNVSADSAGVARGMSAMTEGVKSYRSAGGGQALRSAYAKIRGNDSDPAKKN